ncbi:MAG: EAL domain-containing protein [Xanthomonadaceae bacterium]|nr:EAL domain-containing protein [Xanthomonadaceae bacterium]
MNLEARNTLFVTLLVVAVLCSVSLLGYFLLDDHVHQASATDLERAHEIYVESEKSAFGRLLTTARGMHSEPSLVAATLTGDLHTVRSMLEDLHDRPGVDMMAIYLDIGPGGAVGQGRKPHFTSPQVLSSDVLQDLVQQLTSGGAEAAFGNGMVYDNLLRLVAIPIEHPLGGRLGVMLVGEEFAQRDVERIHSLVQAEVVVFRDDLVLGSSQPGLADIARRMPADGNSAVLRFDVEGKAHVGRLHRILATAGGGGTAAQLLLARPLTAYWGPYQELMRSALIASALILLLAALVGISISRRTLTRPIQSLVRATRAIADGNFDQRIAIQRNDELGELATSFKGMIASLSSSREEVERSRRRFRDFAGSSSDWLWETDRNGRFLFVSETVRDNLGFGAEQLLGRTFADVFPGSNLVELMSLLRPGQHEMRNFKDVECWVSDSEGERHCLRLNAMAVREGDQHKGYRGTARDITKSKQDEQNMMVLANQDHLTGLSNRSRFLKDLEHEVRRVERVSQSGALMLVDLDHLKLINDTSGHFAGDEMIVQVAGLLKRLSRDEDLIARLSGDEFALAFPAMDEAHAMEKARQLLDRIQELKPRLGDRTVNLSASIGVALFPQHGNAPVELLAKADTAMYAAKDAGRNRALLFDEAAMAQERMNSQLAWKDRLVEAIEQDLFVLAFQPIVSVASGHVHHYEVLVRMKAPGDTLFPPGKFIPTAEQFGLIHQVDRIIVTKAIRYLAEHRDEHPDAGFSINLSGMSVGNEEMFELIAREIRASGVAPERFTFEVTETAACEKLNDAIDFIAKVRKLGCHISLDDFGVGFSSFSYLKHLRVDTLKIDGSFIREIHENNADQLFVKALVDVARGMGIKTIAEFVENEAVYRLVSRLGVDYVQGYYLGKPRHNLELRLPPPGNLSSQVLAG